MTMKTKEKVLHALTKFGLLPDEEDGQICFFYQMSLYLYVPDDDDENYVSIYIPCIYEVTEENESEVLLVINDCNVDVKAVKLIVANKANVWAAYEIHVPEDADLEDVVRRGVLALYNAKERFIKDMKGL